ncbi:fam43, putative [Pediculus humanus corporis]|uniref:Fam43, putative n=1 Tax=Pediculus humanus subsp. corporis TaxID=121224 RepID=E0VC17_PEDHC|nr:fam43, putative [Pediculus humanus corporis]EEB10923.1 fam43, putative [Pediculus humanus corporis]
MWKRGSATITAEDPTYKVSYLGNVLTGLAKGEGCIEKPLNTLWKNYNESLKPSIQMKIKVTQSGLKAVTKDHGLIEYWSHRITFCTVPPEFPNIFCWIYRHEGRKLKQELRCHAVLCSKESVASKMSDTLKTRLTQALVEFKRDKLLRQNARLSLVNSVYDNPSLPKRKILLSTGCHNYKPPIERSKSAPKLMKVSDDGNKSDYKLANLSFVKKLCSSIENLVESTSNYSRKFFTERKSNRETSYVTIKNSDESGKKLDNNSISEINLKSSKMNVNNEGCNIDDFKSKFIQNLSSSNCRITSDKKDIFFTSDNNSNPVVVTSVKNFNGNTIERLPNYLSTGKSLPEGKIVVFNCDCQDSQDSSPPLVNNGQEVVVSLDDDDDDNNKCVQLTDDLLVQKLTSLDVPYHKIIKSTALSEIKKWQINKF